MRRMESPGMERLTRERLISTCSATMRHGIEGSVSGSSRAVSLKAT